MTAPSTMTTDSRRLFAGLPGFAATTVALIALSGWAMTLAFHGIGDSLAIRTSAVVAAAVQIGAYPVVRRLASQNPMLGWGVGSLVRLVSLIVYALVAESSLHLPLAAALLSLLAFYFLSMLIEPLFLRAS
jgi:hypothetical protein